MEQGSKYQNYNGVRVMVFNTTFNNISVTCISWWSVLLVKETGVPRENHQTAASHRQTLLHNVVSSTPHHEQGSKSHDIHLNTLRTSVVAMLDFRLAITIYNILALSVPGECYSRNMLCALNLISTFLWQRVSKWFLKIYCRKIYN